MANAGGGLAAKINGFVSEAALHWSKPAKGNYVPYKEIAGYSVGMFGYYCAIALVSKIGLDGTNAVIAQALGVDPTHVTMMNVLNTFVCFWLTMFRSHVVDNSRNRNGRFRPFIKRFGIPTVLLAFAVVWFPYQWLPDGGLTGTGYWMKVGIIMFLFLGIQLVWPFYSLGFNDLVRVLSPNSQERQNVIAITSIVWSLAPTIYNPIITMISGHLPNRTADITLYKYAFIPITLLGVAMSYVGYYTTHERIIQSREHINKINIIQAFRSVAKNKNFWIICAAGWVGFLEGASGDIWEWAFTYQERFTGEQRALVDFLVSNAALWAMLLTPLLTKRFGKRAVLIGSNVLNILLLGVTYNTYNLLIPFAVFRYVNFFLGTVQQTIGPAIDADIRDAQQYLSGERIDGMFGLVGYVGSIIGMGTNFVKPALLRRGGIYKGNQAVDNYGNPNMLFALKDPAVYHKMSKTMIVASVIGAMANVIPMFFYDISEKKQRAMARVLRVRAMLEDYGNGVCTPGQMVEGVDIIRQARADFGAPPVTLAPGMTRKQRLEAKIRNEDISVANYVVDELKKFETPEIRRKVELARQISDAGLEGLYRFTPVPLSADPKLRAIEREHNNALRRAQSNVTRCYPNHDIQEPDLAACEALYDLPEDSREQAKSKNAAIKAMEAERSKFINSAKPFTDARRLLTEMENQTHLEAILAQYDEAVTQTAENERKADEAAALEREARKLETERLKEERRLEKAAKKKK